MDAASTSVSELGVLVWGPGLLFGLMLLAAIVGGHIAHLLYFPRVIGFVVAGAALRAALKSAAGPEYGIIEGQVLELAAEPLDAIRDLALGLILFLIGRAFDRSRVRAGGTGVLKISCTEVASTFLLVFLGCFAAAALARVPFDLADKAVLALLLAAAAIATAPAATLFVLREYEAKGSASETIISLTGANNAVCILLFQAIFLLLAFFSAIDTSGSLAGYLWLALALTTLGSMVLGLICGTLLAVAHAKLPLSETLLVFFALFIVLGASEKWLLGRAGMSFSFLLTCLMTGAVFTNVAIDSQKLENALETVGFPILAGFFVLAGYGLHLGDLAHMGWIGGAYVLCRSAGKVIGCRLGGKWAQRAVRGDEYLGSALLCQAAVVIGLSSFVERNWAGDAAKTFSTVILGSVVLFELVGPLLVKRCVVRAGEVKVITLLRRAGSGGEGASFMSVTFQALLRLFGLQRRQTAEGANDVSVEYIMRTNAQLIPASATLDEVLHFIERSTHSHFPVVHESGELAGVIHFSDVREVIYDPALRELVTAVDLADPNSAVVSMDMPASELLDVFTNENVAVLPVVERARSKRIVGIVEQRDLLRALHAARD